MALSKRVEVLGVALPLALLLVACGGSEHASIPPVQPVFIPMPNKEDELYDEDEESLEEAAKPEGAAAAAPETKPGAEAKPGAAPATAGDKTAKPGATSPAGKPATAAPAKPAATPAPAGKTAPAPAAKPAPAPATPTKKP